MEYNKDTLCLFPFSHVSPQQHGPIRQCCIGNDILDNDGNVILYDVHKAFNSNHMNRIRSDLSSGIKAKECNYCWSVEKSGGMSMRQGTFYRNWANDVNFDDPKIRCLDIRFSNVCNIKCLSCNPEKSNQIGIEEGVDNPTKILDSIYTSLIKLAPDIREINFLGGEPMIHKEMYNSLDYLIENGYSHNISLKYSTNVTVLKDEFIEKLEKFKFTKIGVSIDAYGKRDEYIRFPSKWKVIEKNLRRYRNNFPNNAVLKVQQVCSNLAMGGIDEFYDWYMSIDDNQNVKKTIDHLWLEYPSHLRCNIIPVDKKENIRERLQSIPGMEAMLSRMMQPYTEEEKNAFVEYIKRKDKLRGVNILDYCPEFEEWFS